MATYNTAVTAPRLGASAKTFYAATTKAGTAIVAPPRTYGAPANSDAIYAVNGRDYAIGRAEGGSGDATRPLVGLLHPPDRRGNRAQAATP